MNSDELLGQAPTVTAEAEASVQAFLAGEPAKKANQPEAKKAEIPRQEPVALPPEPPKKSVDMAQGRLDVVDEAAFQTELEEAEAALDLLQMAPAQRYLKILEREKVTLEEARKIIDTTVLQLKRYQERVFLTRTMSVVFQTRSQADQERFNRVLEAEMPHYEVTVRTHSVTYNIASSLVRYGDKEFPRENDADFKAILQWISNLPMPAFVLLNRKLIEFDNKVNLVFQEGWLENF